MRIMIVEPGSQYSTLAVACGYYDAFNDLGYETLQYDTSSFFEELKIMTANSEREYKWNEVTEVLSSPILNHIIQDKIDVIVVIHGWHMNPSIIQSARMLGVKTALALTDEPQQVDVSNQWSKFYDYVFTNDINTIKRHHDCHFLPTAVNEKIFYERDVNSEFKSDILIGGSFYKERIDFLSDEKLVETLSKYETKCVGARRFELTENDPKSKWFGENRISIERMSEYVAGTKICIDIPRNEFICGVFGEANNMKIKASNLSPRIYEASASGTLVLTSDEREDINRLFPEKMFPTYNNVAELCSMIDYYMENEVERKQIVNKQREYCLENHTYKNRVKTIESVMNIRKTKKVEERTKSVDGFVNDKIIEKYDKDWLVNINKLNEHGFYIEKFNIKQDKNKYGGEGVIISNGPSIEKTTDYISYRFREEDIFCLNKAMCLMERFEENWGNAIIIHPEEGVYERSVKNLNDVNGKTLYASSVCAHKCVIDWFKRGGGVRLFNTSDVGPKRIVSALTAFPMLGAGVTVAFSALTVLKYLGYRHIHLFGVDFCYVDNKAYAYENYSYDQLKDNELILTEDCFGNPVLTNPTFMKSLECCKEFIKRTQDIEFIFHGNTLCYDKNIGNLKNVHS